MTNRKAKQKQESRQAIQASAAALLRERGIKASSVMDVMKGAGLTVGGFYNHFDSKEEPVRRGAAKRVPRKLEQPAEIRERRFASGSRTECDQTVLITPAS
jgi:AcrR family transcriptional regulator